MRGDPFHSSRAVLKNFNVRAKNFDATMEHTNLDKVQVAYNEWPGRSQRGQQALPQCQAALLQRGRYRRCRRVLLQGEAARDEVAGEPRGAVQECWLRSGWLKKGWLTLLCYLKCAAKFISFITWGFGERPIRSLLLSMG